MQFLNSWRSHEGPGYLLSEEGWYLKVVYRHLDLAAVQLPDLIINMF